MLPLELLPFDNEKEVDIGNEKQETLFILSLSNKQILRQCFRRWKQLTEHSKNLKDEKLKKIDTLLEQILKFKQNSSRTTTNSNTPKKHKKAPTETYKNRFEAQKALIEIQKTKITEQNKLIEDLKLGIMRDEIKKTAEETKLKVSEAIDKLSPSAKIKMGPRLIDIEANLLKFMVNSSQAPKFTLKMEERAYQRARNREIILEKKKRMDEEKQRLLEEALESKRIQDEEERKRNLEEIEERRKKELEMQKARRLNKERFLANWNKAERFHSRKLSRKCLYGLIFNYLEIKRKLARSERFYEIKVKKSAFKAWKEFMEELWREDNEKADRLYRKKIMETYFALWLMVFRYLI